MKVDPKVVKRVRKELNLTRKDIAEILGIHPTSVMCWEKGRAGMNRKNVESFQQLAHENGVDTSGLILGITKRGPRKKKPEPRLGPKARQLRIEEFKDVFRNAPAKWTVDIQGDMNVFKQVHELAKSEGLTDGQFIGDLLAAFVEFKKES